MVVCRQPFNIRQLAFRSDLHAILAVLPSAISLISEQLSTSPFWGLGLKMLSLQLRSMWLTFEMGFVVHSEDKKSFGDKNYNC